MSPSRADHTAWLVVLAGVVAALQVGKLPPALPALQADLGLTLVQSGFLLSIVQLAGLSLAVFMGLWADGMGLKRSMLSGLCLLALAERTSEARGASDASARQVASALYHLTTATAMAWEAGQTGSARRMRLAQWVLRQRLLPQDPLALDGEPAWLPALLEPGAATSNDAVDTINLF